MNLSLVQLHLAAFLFGAAGVVAQLTTLNVLVVVEARAGLAALALLCWARLRRIPLRVERRQLPWFVLIGLLLAFHWYSFFLAIRLTSVAIGLLTFSCFPLFVILLAPLVDRSALKRRDLALVAVLLFGLSMVLPASDWRAGSIAGPLWGIASGFSFALIQLINHTLVQQQSPVKISVYQNAIAAVALLPFLDAAMLGQAGQAWPQIVFLGLICTAFAHTIFIGAMRRVKAQTASLFTFLEPVYGIALAAWVLNEIPSLRSLLGGLIILASVLLASRAGQGAP